MPVAFISDFGPMPAVESDDYTEALARFGESLPRPRAIVVMSGHWEARKDLAVSASAAPAIIHDYYGFPPEFYAVRYPVAGDPALAGRVIDLLQAAGLAAHPDADRGLDHGAWVPLSRVYPRADIPTVQITVPAGRDPRFILEVGRALAPLRNEGVLLLSAGTLIHNLRRVHFQGKFDAADAWAEEFARWLEERLGSPDVPCSLPAVDELVEYRARAPHASLAAPTTEHFDPLFFALGAAEGETVTHHYRAIRYGNGLLSIFRFGSA